MGLFPPPKDLIVRIAAVITLATPCLSGDGYTSKDIPNVAVPLAITVMILIGMLTLLCYFKRQEIRKNCCGKHARPRESVVLMNEPTLETVKSVGPGNPAPQATYDDIETTKCKHCHHAERMEEGKHAIASPSGGNSKPSQAREVEGKTNRLTRFLGGPMSRSEQGIQGRQSEGNQQPSENVLCEKCTKCASYEQKALGQQDITGIGVPLRTSDVCHI